MPNIYTQDIFSIFYNYWKDGKKIQIGFFCVLISKLIGNLWKNASWYAFAVAIIINLAGGKIIVFWDCDLVNNIITGLRAKDVFWGK